MARRSKGPRDLELEVQQLQAEVRRLRQQLAEAESRRTRYLPTDKRKAIEAMLKRGGLTDREIARRTNTSPTTIGRIRREVLED